MQLVTQSKKRREQSRKEKSQQLMQTELTYDDNNTDLTFHLSLKLYLCHADKVLYKTP